MINSLDAFFQRAADVVTAFDEWTQSVRPNAIADHMGWKCASSEEFERMRAMFEGQSRFVYQSIISHRRITIIGLMQSISSALGEIRILELSDQKPDGSQKSGFDHIEIYPVSGTVEQLASALAAYGTAFEKTVRPHHTTYDAAIPGGLMIRLEAEPLIEKIKREELSS